MAPAAVQMIVDAPKINNSVPCCRRFSPANTPCIRSTAWVIGKRFDIFLIVFVNNISGIVAPDRNSMIK